MSLSIYRCLLQQFTSVAAYSFFSLLLLSFSLLQRTICCNTLSTLFFIPIVPALFILLISTFKLQLRLAMLTDICCNNFHACLFNPSSCCNSVATCRNTFQACLLPSVATCHAVFHIQMYVATISKPASSLIHFLLQHPSSSSAIRVSAFLLQVATLLQLFLFSLQHSFLSLTPFLLQHSSSSALSTHPVLVARLLPPVFPLVATLLPSTHPFHAATPHSLPAHPFLVATRLPRLSCPFLLQCLLQLGAHFFLVATLLQPFFFSLQHSFLSLIPFLLQHSSSSVLIPF